MSTENPTLSPAGAVVAFAAWLTCRDQPVTFGATYDAVPAADLAKAFNESQGFPELPADWHKCIKPYPR